MTKKIILCADDFGFCPSVSKGILELAQKEVLSAVSVMMPSAALQPNLSYLEKLDTCDIGLHVNLTEGANNYSVGELLARCLSHSVNKNYIESEIRKQFDLFFKTTKKLPDFIDGHQHVHQFPVIRDILLPIVEDLYQNTKQHLWIRSIYPQTNVKYSFVKSLILRLSGSKRFKASLSKRNITTNTSFAGMTQFSNDYRYREMMQDWLASAKDNGLIMCHPAHSGETSTVEHWNNRAIEYNYLLSKAFLEDLDTANAYISQLNNQDK